MGEIRQLMEVNYFGTVLMTRAVWPRMVQARVKETLRANEYQKEKN